MEDILFGLLALVGAAMAAAVLIRPSLGFVAILVMFPFEVALQSFKPSLILQYPWVVNVGAAMVALAGLILCFTQRRQPLKSISNAGTWLVLFLYSWILMTFLWTPTLEAASHFLKLAWPYIVLLFIVMPLLISKVSDVDEIIRPFLILGALTAFFIFVNPHSGFARGRLTIDFGYVAGVGDIASNPLALADLGGMLAIAAALYRARSKSTVQTLLQVGAFLGGMGLAVASGSRGQVLSAGAICIVLYPLLAERKNFTAIFSVAIGGIIVSAIMVSLYLFLFSNVQDNRWTLTDIRGGTSDRLSFATELIAGYTGSPAFWIQGLGASAFNVFYKDPSHSVEYYYPHNIFVEALAEYGLVGLVTLMAICFVCAKQWASLYRIEGRDANTRSTCTVLLGMTLFQFLMSLKQGSMFSPPMLFAFTILIGKMATRSQMEAASAEYETENWQPDSDELEQLQLAYANEDPRQD